MKKTISDAIKILTEDKDKTEKEIKISNEDSYKDFLESHKDKTNVQIIQAALKAEKQIPPRQLAKLKQFSALLSPELIPNESDRNIIAELVNTLDLGAMPDPVRFVQHSIYGNEQISEETKEQIATKLGIPRLKNIDTGSKIQEAFDQGHGIDAGTGEPIPFTEKHPAILDDYTVMYEKSDGTRTLDFKVPDGRHFFIKFDASATGKHVGEITHTIQTMVAMEHLNLSNAIFGRGDTIDHGGTIDLHYDDIIKAKRVAQIFIGGNRGYDGRIFDNSIFERLTKDFQGLHPKGDFAKEDNDPLVAQLWFQSLGIVDEGGNIDWKVFEAAATYLQSTASKQGAFDPFLLRDHLFEQFPDRVLPSSMYQTGEVEEQQAE